MNANNIPTGFVLVPREPTFEMNKAGQEAVWDFHPEDTIEGNEETARAAYWAMLDASPSAAGQTATDYARIGLLEWAVERWRSSVQNRPLVNIHRRTMDDCWRSVMRYAGGNPDDLVGPSHDELLSGGASNDR